MGSGLENGRAGRNMKYAAAAMPTAATTPMITSGAFEPVSGPADSSLARRSDPARAERRSFSVANSASTSSI
jgi:hypothetical protein